MRSPIRRWYAAVAALSVALLVAGCGGVGDAASSGAGSGADSREVLLQPVAAQGPDPYTASTARNMTPPLPPPPPRSSVPGSQAGTGPAMSTFLGSTPGLYGGTEAIGSCDVGQQITLLSRDRVKTRAFAQGMGVAQADVPNFLRGLTSVILRADTRVTGHGFRDGSTTAYQSVLQAGTAVLVDQYGAPRVRCVGGNPLKPPVAVKGALVHKGRAWAGYRPEQVIVIKPTATVINNLVIVSVRNNSWIERRVGTDGEEDRKPAVLPPVHPDDVFANPQSTQLTGPSDPAAPSGQAQPVNPTGPSAPAAPSDQAQPVNPAGPSAPVEPSGQAQPGDPAGPGDDTQGSGDPSTPDCPAPATLEPGEESVSSPLEPGCPTPTLTGPGQPPVDPSIDPFLDPFLDPAIDPAIDPAVDPDVAPDVPVTDELPPAPPALLTSSAESTEPDTFQG
ncbi:DUF6777 domain-containing protein [Streptomyces sp. NPDC002730]|uniref:DUF6777 domain-containing protein n=1 Tax=Streptomyces sp. NPDC002730 TaxID=3364662 RepID=UPI0036A03F49